MDIMSQVGVNEFTQILVMLSSLYRFSFVHELAIIVSNVLGFSNVEF